MFRTNQFRYDVDT